MSKAATYTDSELQTRIREICMSADSRGRAALALQLVTSDLTVSAALAALQAAGGPQAEAEATGKRIAGYVRRKARP